MMKYRSYSRFIFLLSVVVCLSIVFTPIVHVQADMIRGRDTISSYLDQSSVSDQSKSIITHIKDWLKDNKLLSVVVLGMVISSICTQVLNGQAPHVDTTQFEYMTVNELFGEDLDDVIIHNGTNEEWIRVCIEQGGFDKEYAENVGAWASEDGKMYFSDSLTFVMSGIHEYVHYLENNPRITFREFRKMRKNIGSKGSVLLREKYIAVERFILEKVPTDAVYASYDVMGLLPIAREFYAYYYQFLFLGWLDYPLTEEERSQLGDWAVEFIDDLYKLHKTLQLNKGGNHAIQEMISKYFEIDGLSKPLPLINRIEPRLYRHLPDHEDSSAVNSDISIIQSA